MSRAIIGRWGKSLAIRFPAEIVEAAGFKDGERVELLPHAGEVVVRRLTPALTVEDMFRDKEPEEWRRLYADAYDWGDDRGHEIVEE